MNRFKKIFAVGLLSIAFSSVQAAVVDFEDQVTGFYPEVTTAGVTFQGYDVTPYVDLGIPHELVMSDIQSGFVPPAPLMIAQELEVIVINPLLSPVANVNQFLSLPSLFNDFPPPTSAIMMNFDGLVNNLSFDFGYNLTDWWAAAFVGSDMVELGALAPNELGLSNSYNFSYAADISSVLIINAGIGPWMGDAIALDNVAFTSAVPEPSMIALILGGLGLVGFMANRRNKA